MKNKIILSLILSMFMVSGAVAVNQDNLPTNQPDTNNLDIQQGEMSEQSFWDSVLSTLSFSGVQSSYSPGENIDVEITANTETSYDTDDAQKVVNIYKCADSGCDDAPPISSSSEDQCSSEEWWPSYDDCVASDSDGVSFSVTQDPGTSWSWDVSFNGFQDEATYVLVGYVWTPDQGIVTDVSEEQFTVQESTSTEPEPEAVVDEVDGDIPVKVENGQIIATPEFINTGDGDMSETNIVEMQVRPEGSGFLSYISPNVGTCDSSYPENVHKEFRLDSGDSREISLSTSVDNVEAGESYDVKIITRSSCGGSAVEPYGTGVTADTIFIEESDSTEPDNSGVQVEQASESITMSTSDSSVSTSFSFVNTGDTDMSDSDIVEMQVVPKGSGLLSAVTGTSVQSTCDSSYPQNVHKEFRIGAGETVDVDLSTGLSNLEEDSSYDVWIVTREECGGGPVDPYGTGVRVGSFTYEESGPVEEPGLPLVPIVAGLVLVAGGVFYLWRN